MKKMLEVRQTVNTAVHATTTTVFIYSGIPRNFVQGGSTNSVEDRGQREQGSGGGSPLVRGSAQFSNE
jgi:uncharacterized spore protein YtfJ